MGLHSNWPVGIDWTDTPNRRLVNASHTKICKEMLNSAIIVNRKALRYTMSAKVSPQNSISRAASVESLIDGLTEKAKIIFDSLDTEGRGFLVASQLAEASGIDSSDVAFHEILSQMDLDGDGLINFSDFCESFQEIVLRRSFYQCPQSCSHLTLLSLTSHSDEEKPSVTGSQMFDDSASHPNSKLEKRASIFRRIRARENQRHLRQLRRQPSSRSFSVASLLDLTEEAKHTAL